MLSEFGDFDFSLSGILSSFIFSVIGFWIFRQGKQQFNYRTMIIGFCMMIYTYFTKGPWADWGVGIALSALAYYYW